MPVCSVNAWSSSAQAYTGTRRIKRGREDGNVRG